MRPRRRRRCRRAGDRGGPVDGRLHRRDAGGGAPDRPRDPGQPDTPAPGESPGQFWEATGQDAAARTYRQRISLGRNDFDPVEDFFHDVPDAVRHAAFDIGEPGQSDTPFEQPWPLPAWPAVATRVLQGADDRLFPLEFQRRVVRDRLGLDVDVIPGGHLVALSRPDLVAHKVQAYRGGL